MTTKKNLWNFFKFLFKINEQEFKGILTCIYPLNIISGFITALHMIFHSLIKSDMATDWCLWKHYTVFEAGVLIGRVEEWQKRKEVSAQG